MMCERGLDLCYGYPAVRSSIQAMDHVGPTDSYGPRALTASKIQMKILLSYQCSIAMKDNMTMKALIKEAFNWGWFIVSEV